MKIYYDPEIGGVVAETDDTTEAADLLREFDTLESLGDSIDGVDPKTALARYPKIDSSHYIVIALRLANIRLV